MPRYRMTAEQAAQYLATRPGVLRLEMRGAMGEALAVTLEEAQRLSSGFFTQADHRRDGHPYARRHGRILASRDPVVINIGSGQFLQAWQDEGPFDAGGGLAGRVVNRDRKADWLHRGTARMLPRPIAQETVHRATPRVEEIVARRLADALRF